METFIDKIKIYYFDGLIEGNVIAVKLDSIENRFPGGTIAFRAFFHSKKAYSDRNLFAVSFLSPDDADNFVITLGEIDFITNEVAFLSQIQGVVYPVDWIGIKEIEYKNTRKICKACLLKKRKAQRYFRRSAGLAFQRQVK